MNDFPPRRPSVPPSVNRTMAYRLPILPKPLTTLADALDLSSRAVAVDVRIRTVTVYVDDIEAETVYQMVQGYFVLAAYPATQVKRMEMPPIIGVSEGLELFETSKVTLLLQRVEP